MRLTGSACSVCGGNHKESGISGHRYYLAIFVPVAASTIFFANCLYGPPEAKGSTELAVGGYCDGGGGGGGGSSTSIAEVVGRVVVIVVTCPVSASSTGTRSTDSSSSSSTFCRHFSTLIVARNLGHLGNLGILALAPGSALVILHHLGGRCSHRSHPRLPR